MIDLYSAGWKAAVITEEQAELCEINVHGLISELESK